MFHVFFFLYLFFYHFIQRLSRRNRGLELVANSSNDLILLRLLSYHNASTPWCDAECTHVIVLISFFQVSRTTGIVSILTKADTRPRYQGYAIRAGTRALLVVSATRVLSPRADHDVRFLRSPFLAPVVGHHRLSLQVARRNERSFSIPAMYYSLFVRPDYIKTLGWH